MLNLIHLSNSKNCCGLFIPTEFIFLDLKILNVPVKVFSLNFIKSPGNFCESYFILDCVELDFNNLWNKISKQILPPMYLVPHILSTLVDKMINFGNIVLILFIRMNLVILFYFCYIAM